MAVRQVVLLTPPESSHPTQLLSRQHSIRVSPLFATLTNRPQIIENSNSLSPAFATLTDFAPLSPVFATHTKITGVYINNSHSETRFRPSRFLCNLRISALNSVFAPSTFNFQLSPSCPSRDLYSQPLTNCPPHNLFLLTSLQMPGGYRGRVQEFLKHYFNCAGISARLNHLPGRGFHEPRATEHAFLPLPQRCSQSGPFFFTVHGTRVTGHESRVTSHESPVTSHGPQPCLKSYSPVALLWAYNRVLSSFAFRPGERPFPPSWRSL